MRHVIRATGPGGAIETISIDAENIDSARAQARSAGWQVLEARAVAPWHQRLLGRADASTAGGRSASASFDLGLFAREMASLLEAGIGVVDSLRTLSEREAKAGVRAIFAALVAELEQGRGLPAALQSQPAAFPEFFVASVRAAERGGDLAVALRRYAEGHERIRVLKSRLAGAAIYPAVLLAVGALVIAFLLGFVVPRFAAIIEGTRRELPWMSQLIIHWGTFVNAHADWVVLTVCACLTGLLMTGRSAAARRWLLVQISRWPLIGPTLRGFRRAQFYRAAAMLVEGGMPAVRAFELATHVLLDNDRRRVGAAIERIRTGVAASFALQEAGVADPVAFRMLRVAESTGQLGPVLGRIGAFAEQELGHRVDLLTRLVEPALMVFIGLVIGGIVVLMYLPIFELASSLQ